MSFVHNIRRSHVLAGLLVAALASSVLGRSTAAALRSSVSWAFAVGGDAGMYLTTFVKSKAGQDQRVTPAQYKQVQSAADHYKQRYHASLKTIIELNRQIRQMRSLFDTLRADNFPAQLFEARVIATDSLPYGRFRSINSGTDRGAEVGSMVTTRFVLTPNRKALPERLAVVKHHLLAENQAMITNQVLVGRIVETWKFGARVQLITDRGFRMPARIWRDVSNRRSIKVLQRGNARQVPLTIESKLIDVTLTGDGAGSIEIADVPERHNIQPGDWVMTRRDRWFLPARIPIARIVEVRRQAENPGFVRIQARPIADLDAVRNVYIVYPTSRPHRVEE